MSDAVASLEDVRLETVCRVPVEWLMLDRRNPRLMWTEKDVDETEVIAHLYRAEDLEELLHSISANGYLDIEPLVVLEENKRLLVLEGNRRLAAILLFREPGLAAHVSERQGFRITVPPISDEHLNTLDQVSVYRVASRWDARSFIGFKHINGPAKWDAYAKAQFAAEWYESGKSEDVSLKTIADSIGDRHDTIKRMVSAIYVLEQAKNEGLFDIQDRYHKKLNFSHLYTALGRSQYMNYLGLGEAWTRHDPAPDQVPRENLQELEKLLLWIYGSKKEDVLPVIRTQNPDIKRLGEVLAHAGGLNVLEATRNLDAAHASTEPAQKKFTASLVRARDNIREAAGSVRGYDGQDKSLLDIAVDIKATAESVHTYMLSKQGDTGDEQ